MDRPEGAFVGLEARAALHVTSHAVTSACMYSSSSPSSDFAFVTTVVATRPVLASTWPTLVEFIDSRPAPRRPFSPLARLCPVRLALRKDPSNTAPSPHHRRPDLRDSVPTQSPFSPSPPKDASPRDPVVELGHLPDRRPISKRARREGRPPAGLSAFPPRYSPCGRQPARRGPQSGAPAASSKRSVLRRSLPTPTEVDTNFRGIAAARFHRRPQHHPAAVARLSDTTNSRSGTPDRRNVSPLLVLVDQRTTVSPVRIPIAAPVDASLAMTGIDASPSQDT